MKKFLITAAAFALLTTAATAGQAVPTSAEDDLRTGDIGIKNGVSGKCAEQVMQHRATADCEQEAQRWSDELTTKLSNPAWRAQFTRKLNAIIQD